MTKSTYKVEKASIFWQGKEYKPGDTLEADDEQQGELERLGAVKQTSKKE